MREKGGGTGYLKKLLKSWWSIVNFTKNIVYALTPIQQITFEK